LVVDDSAYVRKVVSQMLTSDPRMQVVGIAADGEEALEKAAELDPDVITLDLEMPRCNGLQFLQRMSRGRRVPVVVVSTQDQSGEMVLGALESGAFDFVHKPTALANEQLYSVADMLVEKVAAAARMSPRQRDALYLRPTPQPIERQVGAAKVSVVVLGISTGGPMALREILPALPADFPVPVLVVIHMPADYTGPYAERLDAVSALSVVEARPELRVEPGLVILAQGGMHMTVNSARQIRLDRQPDNLLHRPSVDVLFQSAADIYGAGVLGVIMTGMGNDGTAGARSIKAVGGTILAQSEETCVVYGMPRAAVEAGLVDQVVALPDLAAEIVRRAG
jgi:two-component system chemotaxis response regulator CheB